MPVVAMDCETYLIAPGLATPRVVCWSYCDEDGDKGLLLRDDALLAMHALLDNDDVLLVGHNTRFDMACLCAADPTLLSKVFRAYDLGRIRDTMIREKLLMLAVGQLADEGQGGALRGVKYSLDAVVFRRFGVDLKSTKKDPESWRLRYKELDGVPIEQWPAAAREYALDDASYTMAVYAAQAVDAPEGVVDEVPQVRAAFWLYLMGAWGVRTDPARVNALAEHLRAEMQQCDSVLREVGILQSRMVKGSEVWSKNMLALRERVVLAYGGESNAPKTAGGAVATDRDTLVQSGDPVLEKAGERSGVEKMLTTFVPALLEGTQVPICAGWNELVATGRTSCFKPNLQQLPRKGNVRECFVPRLGYLYAVADYSYIELCTLAQICLDQFGESRLADAINAGLDPHLDMAAILLGISYEEAKRRRKEPEVKDARQLSKALNFGLPGGLGAEKFVLYARAGYGVIITEEKAKTLKPVWYSKWPEMRRFHKLFGDQTQMGQTFTLQQPRSGRLRGGCSFCDGCNSTFQGLAADGAKNAGWRISKECYLTDPYRDGTGSTHLYGSRTVLFGHDEFVLEVPEDRAGPAALRLAEVAIAGMKEYVPDVAVKAEPVLMRRLYKGLDPVYDENGTPVVCEPERKEAAK